MNPETRSSNWLSSFARDVTSQRGEDGIIEKALEVIGEADRWCVEFGAWDGRLFSNTYSLVADKGYSAVLIEADPKRFAELEATHGGNEGVHLLNELVGIGAADGLDTVLARTPVPEGFDVLSIDIDGADYHAWRASTRYRPKVVVIEFNPTIPSEVEFVQPPDLRVNQGSSLLSLARLGREKGYELVAATEFNGIFVREDYFPRFGIDDNSPAALRPHAPVAYVFQGFDGTLFVEGLTKLGWHDLPISQRRLQQLPRYLRRYPQRYNLLQRLLLRIYRRLRS